MGVHLGAGYCALLSGAKCFEVHHAVRRLERTMLGMQSLLLNLLGTNTCNNRALVELCLAMKASLERNKLLPFYTVPDVLEYLSLFLSLSPYFGIIVFFFLFKAEASDIYKELNF